MTRVLDVRVPGELHVSLSRGCVELGLAVAGRMVAWEPLSTGKAMAVADALEGGGPDVDELGFTAGRCGGGALLSFLGTSVILGAGDASKLASHIRKAAGGADP